MKAHELIHSGLLAMLDNEDARKTPGISGMEYPHEQGAPTTLSVQEPYYMVGRRPLDWIWGGHDLGSIAFRLSGKAGKDHNLRLEHQHFLGSNGENFGFTDTGEFEEKSREKDYSYDVPNIGNTKFKAKYMDMARLMAREQIEADVDQMKEQMDAFSIENGEYMVNAYSFQSRNCQEYVDKVIGIARELAKRNGDSLEIR